MPTTYSHQIHLPSGGTARAVAAAHAAYDDLPAFTVALLVRYDNTWDGVVCAKGVVGTSGWHLNESSRQAFDMVQQRATTQDLERDGGYASDNSWRWIFIAQDRVAHTYARATGLLGSTIADIHRGFAATGAGAVVAEGGPFRLGGDDTHFASGATDIRFVGICASVLTLIQMQAVANDPVAQAALFVDYWKPGVADATKVSGAKAVLPDLIYSNGAVLAANTTTASIDLYPFSDFKAAVGESFSFIAEPLDATGYTSTDSPSFGSSDAAVLTIDAVTGRYTPVANGTVTVTCTAGSATATRVVTVVTPTPGVPIESVVTQAVWQARIAALSSPGPVKNVATDYAGDLQAAYAAAVAAGGGWTLECPLGSESTNFVINARPAQLITIKMVGAPPPRGLRSTPAVVAAYNFPRIWSRNTNAAVSTDPTKRTGNVRFIGIDMGLAVGDTNKLANVGAYYSPGVTRLSLLPRDIYCDHVFFRGRPGAYHSRFGWGVEGAWCAAIDCDSADHHYSTGTPEAYAINGEANSDSQGWRTVNGPGPIYAENCGWQSSHETVGIGGNDNAIQNLIIRDILGVNCYLNRPAAWRGVFTCKNLVEVKHGMFVQFKDCVYDHAWVDQQTGHAIIIWAVNQGGSSPETATRDVWIRNGIVKQAAKLITVADRQSNFASALMHRCSVTNVACIGMDSSPDTLQPGTDAHSAGTIIGFGANDVGSKNVTLRHVTIIAPAGWGGSWDSTAGGKTWDGLVLEDCVLGGHPVLISALDGNGAAAWNAKAGVGARFRNNIVIDDTGASTPSGGANTNNVSLTSVTANAMVTPAKAVDPTATLADLAIPPGSPYLGTNRGGTFVTTDGADPGADMVYLASIYAKVVSGDFTVAAPAAPASRLRGRRHRMLG